jgi:hypothetical protein
MSLYFRQFSAGYNHPSSTSASALLLQAPVLLDAAHHRNISIITMAPPLIEEAKSCTIVKKAVSTKHKRNAPSTTKNNAAPPPVEDMVAFVDTVFQISDNLTTTVKAIMKAVGAHFGVAKLESGSKLIVRTRLINLTNGSVKPKDATSQLYAVVDRIFHEADKNTMSFRGVVDSVIAHFRLSDVNEETRIKIKYRLTELFEIKIGTRIVYEIS